LPDRGPADHTDNHFYRRIGPSDSVCTEDALVSREYGRRLDRLHIRTLEEERAGCDIL